MNGKKGDKALLSSRHISSESKGVGHKGLDLSQDQEIGSVDSNRTSDK